MDLGEECPLGCRAEGLVCILLMMTDMTNML